MKIIWQTDARASFKQIARYIKRRFGHQARQSFMLKVKNTETMIKNYPNIGVIDPLYDDCPVAYRSVIINGLSKMVYRIEEETIHIVAFWDCRREPQKQAASSKDRI